METAFTRHLEPWLRELPLSVTVCDAGGTILYMNDRAGVSFAAQGGLERVGTNILNCHPEPARTRLRAIMEKREENVYTVEKQGARKLIFQAPWYRDGAYAGFFELILPIPGDMPHFVRQA
jgi:hypothetical protein